MNPTAAEPAVPSGANRPVPARPQPGPLDYVRKGLKTLASLQLTVVLFALSIALVFFGTLAQMDYGIWTVVDQYFWSWVVWVRVDMFAKFGMIFFDLPRDAKWDGSFPFPGGKLLGGLMLANLLAAHLVRFKLTWKRSGVLLIHSGLILLFVGEFVTREYAVEQRMTIDEGQAVNFTEDTRHVELAFTAPDTNGEKLVVTVPESMLRKAGGKITDPQLPVDIRVDEYMVNSALDDAGPGKENRATAGVGLEAIAVKRAEVSGVDPNQKIDTPSAYITLLKKGTDQPIGTYLISLRLTLMNRKDTVTIDGKPYDVSLRFKRYYKPYSIQLEKFSFDRYMGTEKPRNFSSDVRVIDPDGGADYAYRISMNVPLRHRGETFYQSSFDEATEKTTILQVVKNPGWLLPYISCVVVTLGLILHFGLNLSTFLARRAAA